MKNLTLTVLETQLLNGFTEDSDTFMDGTTEYRSWNESSLCHHINAPRKSVGGVVASLLKKGLIELDYIDDVQVGRTWKEERFYSITAAGLKALKTQENKPSPAVTEIAVPAQDIVAALVVAKVAVPAAVPAQDIVAVPAVTEIAVPAQDIVAALVVAKVAVPAAVPAQDIAAVPAQDIVAVPAATEIAVPAQDIVAALVVAKVAVPAATKADVPAQDTNKAPTKSDYLELAGFSRYAKNKRVEFLMFELDAMGNTKDEHDDFEEIYSSDKGEIKARKLKAIERNRLGYLRVYDTLDGDELYDEVIMINNAGVIIKEDQTCDEVLNVGTGRVLASLYPENATVQDIKEDFVNMINDTDVNAFEPYNYQYSVDVPAHGLDYYIDVDVDNVSYVIEAYDNDTLVVTGAESDLV